MRILVTGGTGFLGKSVVRSLAKDGVDIVCVTRKKSLDNSPGNIKYVTGSLEDKESVERYFEGVNVCIHLAAETQSVSKRLNYESNVTATKNVVELCKKNRVKKIIFTSSVNAQMEHPGPYGKTKLIAENVVKESGLRYIILVPDLIYGKGDRGLTKTVGMIKGLPVIPIIGSGNSIIQPVYVEDAAAAVVSAAKSGMHNKIYYIGGPEQITFNDYIGIIMEKLNLRKASIHIPYALFYSMVRLFSVMDKFPVSIDQCNSIVKGRGGDISDAVRDLNFRPITFLRGLDMFLEE